MRLINQNYFRLEKFTPEQATAIFAVIAKNAGLEFDKEFVLNICREELSNLEDGKVSAVDIQVLAQIVLGFKSFQSKAFTPSFFKEIGGIGGLLQRHLENQFSAISYRFPNQEPLNVLLALIDLDNNLGAGKLSRSEIQKRLNVNIPLKDLDWILEWLLKNRFINRNEEQYGQIAKYEIAHEHLIEPIRILGSQKITGLHEANNLLERRTKEWVNNNRDSHYLLNWKHYHKVKKFKNSLNWGDFEVHKRELINASRKKIRNRIITGILFLFFILIGWLGFTSESYLMTFDVKPEITKLVSQKWGVMNEPNPFYPPNQPTSNYISPQLAFIYELTFIDVPLALELLEKQETQTRDKGLFDITQNIIQRTVLDSLRNIPVPTLQMLNKSAETVTDINLRITLLSRIALLSSRQADGKGLARQLMADCIKGADNIPELSYHAITSEVLQNLVLTSNHLGEGSNEIIQLLTKAERSMPDEIISLKVLGYCNLVNATAKIEGEETLLFHFLKETKKWADKDNSTSSLSSYNLIAYNLPQFEKVGEKEFTFLKELLPKLTVLHNPGYYQTQSRNMVKMARTAINYDERPEEIMKFLWEIISKADSIIQPAIDPMSDLLNSLAHISVEVKANQKEHSNFLKEIEARTKNINELSFKADIYANLALAAAKLQNGEDLSQYFWTEASKAVYKETDDFRRVLQLHGLAYYAILNDNSIVALQYLEEANAIEVTRTNKNNRNNQIDSLASIIKSLAQTTSMLEKSLANKFLKLLEISADRITEQDKTEVNIAKKAEIYGHLAVAAVMLNGGQDFSLHLLNKATASVEEISNNDYFKSSVYKDLAVITGQLDILKKQTLEFFKLGKESANNLKEEHSDLQKNAYNILSSSAAYYKDSTGQFLEYVNGLEDELSTIITSQSLAVSYASHYQIKKAWQVAGDINSNKEKAYALKAVLRYWREKKGENIPW